MLTEQRGDQGHAEENMTFLVTGTVTLRMEAQWFSCEVNNVTKRTAIGSR